MASVASLISLEDPTIDLKLVIHNLSSSDITNNPSDVAYYYTIDFDEWYTHILIYLTDDTFLYSASKNAIARIRKLSTRYIILSNILYIRGYNGLLVHCLNKTKILIALEEAHSGFCGGHFGGKTLIQRLF